MDRKEIADFFGNRFFELGLSKYRDGDRLYKLASDVSDIEENDEERGIGSGMRAGLEAEGNFYFEKAFSFYLSIINGKEHIRTIDEGGYENCKAHLLYSADHLGDIAAREANYVKSLVDKAQDSIQRSGAVDEDTIRVFLEAFFELEIKSFEVPKFKD